YFASINRNKRSIVLDLKSEADRDAFLRLAERADAVVENSKVGVMDRLGVGWERLRERNPRLVYAAIRGFGDPRTGPSPYAEWPAFDIVAQCMGGVVATTGAAGSTAGVPCEAMGGPWLATDPRYDSNLKRVAAAAGVREIIAGWTRQHTKREIVAALAGKVPVGPVNTAEDIFADPHARARGMLVEVEQPGRNRPVVLAGPA